MTGVIRQSKDSCTRRTIRQRVGLAEPAPDGEQTARRAGLGATPPPCRAWPSPWPSRAPYSAAPSQGPVLSGAPLGRSKRDTSTPNGGVGGVPPGLVSAPVRGGCGTDRAPQPPWEWHRAAVIVPLVGPSCSPCTCLKLPVTVLGASDFFFVGGLKACTGLFQSGAHPVRVKRLSFQACKLCLGQI